MVFQQQMSQNNTCHKIQRTKLYRIGSILTEMVTWQFKILQAEKLTFTTEKDFMTLIIIVLENTANVLHSYNRTLHLSCHKLCL